MPQTPCGSISWRHVRLDDGRILVQVSGELVRVWSPTLRTALLGLVPEARSLLVDLRYVTRMDLTGVTMLVALRRHAFARGGEVRLVSPGQAVREVLEATGVQYILPIDDTFGRWDDGLGTRAERSHAGAGSQVFRTFIGAESSGPVISSACT